MIKWTYILLMPLLLSAHPLAAHDASTKISYSASFKLQLATSLLEGATFFNADGIGIKFNDGNSLSGAVIASHSEQLPENFELANYPQYLLGLQPLSALPAAIADKFKRSKEELNLSLNNPVPKVVEVDKFIIYSACNELECRNFVVDKTQSENILMLLTNGFGMPAIKGMIKGN